MEDQNKHNIHLDQNRSRHDSSHQQKPVFQHDEDEIDLRDYINVIKKRKWSILIIFGVAVIAAGVISMLLPLTFEAKSLIEIGQIKKETIEKVNDINAIFSGDLTIQKIKEKLDLPVETTIGILATKFDILEIKGNIAGEKSKLMEIKGRANTPEQAVEIVNVINEMILERHKNLFVQAEKTINIELETIGKNKEKTGKDILKIEQDIIRLNEDIKNYEQEISKRDNIQSDGQGRIAESYINLLAGVKNQKENKESQILNLNQSLINLDQQLQQKEYEKAYETKSSRIEMAATTPETRISPNRKQNVMIAGILGLFIGIFYAFGAEYFSKNNTS